MMWRGLVCVIVLAAWAGGCNGVAAPVAWQGVETAWEFRLPGGAKTPHRLGSFASLPVPGGAWAGRSDANTTAGNVFMAFTPGVDGDYAHPATYFQALAAADADGPLAVVATRVTFTLTDNATGPADNPAASVAVAHPFEVAAAVADGSVAGVVLGGFAVAMSCNPALQPPDAPCNSNGIWATELAVGVDPASVVLSASSVAGVAHFNLSRAWTPSKGGGKPFNYRMTYDVTLSLTVVVGPPPSLAVTPAAAPVALSSTLWARPKPVAAAISGTPGAGATGVVGIASFGFRLVSDSPTERPGRYFESLAFALSDQIYTPSSGVASFNVLLDISTALTTHDSDIDYSLTPVLLQLDGAIASEPVSVAGVVCEDVKLFYKCADHDMPSQLNDTVAYSFRLH